MRHFVLSFCGVRTGAYRQLHFSEALKIAKPLSSTIYGEETEQTAKADKIQ